MDSKDKKPKVKVFSLKIGPIIFSFKKRVNQEKPGHTKKELLAVDRYQSAYFGYKHIGWLAAFLMSRASVLRRVERGFLRQDEVSRARFIKAMKHSANRKERLSKGK